MCSACERLCSVWLIPGGVSCCVFVQSFIVRYRLFNCNLLNKCKIKQYVDLMQKKYISYWNHTLQHSQKLNFYYKIKTNYSPSAYLDLTRKNPSGKTLVKLRICSHKLRIETGRYDNIRKVTKGYAISAIVIEDETHFLLDCPSFSSIRDMFFSKLEPKI